MLFLADGTTETGFTSRDGATVLSVGLALVSAFFSWLQNRDNIKFDFAKRELVLKNEQLERDLAEEIASRTKAEKALATERAERKQTEREMAAFRERTHERIRA